MGGGNHALVGQIVLNSGCNSWCQIIAHNNVNFFPIFVQAHALDHAALAVGYGVEKGQPYWLIKNSWSKAWGDEGYIKIAMKNDNCGVSQKAVVVKIRAE